MMYNIVADQYETHSKQILSDLFNSNDFTDVTFICDDQMQLSAHKSVISSCSSVMKTIISNNPHPNPLIYLKGINHSDLQALLQYIYLGETNIQEERLTEFLNLAKEFLVIGLTDSANSFKIKGVSRKPPSDDAVSTQKVQKKNVKNIPVETLSEDNENSEEINCNECERTFTSKYRLNHHSKYIHKKDFRYCQVCNYKSNGEESLQKHMKSTHEKVML